MPPIDEFWRFVHLPSFDAAWQSLGMTDADLGRLEQTIIADPDAGDVIPGAGGLRKLRFAPGGKGKSGGLRVCYASFPGFGVVLLAVAFGKGRKADLSPAEKKAIRELLRDYGDALKGEP